MFQHFRLVLPMVALMTVVGCGPDYSPNTYSTAAVQQANKVDQGVIAGYREIEIKSDGTIGAVTGGAAGGVLGAQEPDGGVVTALSAIGGTLVGGLIGTGVEHATSDTKAFEYLVRKTNGDLLSLAQKDVTPLPVGLKVLVIEGKQARIVADYSVPPPEALTPSAAKNDGSKGEKSDKANAATEAKTDDANKAVTIGTPSGAPNNAVAAPAQSPPPPGDGSASQAPTSAAQAPAPSPTEPLPAPAAPEQTPAPETSKPTP